MKRVISTMCIGDSGSDGCPPFQFAEKGQELLVIEEINHKAGDAEWRKDYKYVCQDVDKRYGKFYVESHEVKEID
jgi:hypothetical protein